MSRATWSTHVPCHTAAAIPSGTASPMASSIAMRVSSKVGMKRVTRSVSTGWLVTNESPRSPCSTPSM